MQQDASITGPATGRSPRLVKHPLAPALVRSFLRVALAATIAFETAWRIRSEVLTLEWSRVDLAEGSAEQPSATQRLAAMTEIGTLRSELNALDDVRFPQGHPERMRRLARIDALVPTA